LIEAKIIVSSNFDYAKERVLSLIDSKLIKIYERVEFKVDDASEVIREAYISEEKVKYLLLIADSYNVYAQNRLLKLIEEPPRNIVFIIFAKYKTSLLPTIRSRLMVESLEAPKEDVSLGLDLKKMDLQDLFTFVKKNQRLSKGELKQLIELILKNALLDNKIELNSEELSIFERSLELAELNSRSQNILSLLLLMIYNKNRR
jgi:DNA polymerase-3 subunit delta'